MNAKQKGTVMGTWQCITGTQQTRSKQTPSSVAYTKAWRRSIENKLCLPWGRQRLVNNGVQPQSNFNKMYQGTCNRTTGIVWKENCVAIYVDCCWLFQKYSSLYFPTIRIQTLCTYTESIHMHRCTYIKSTSPNMTKFWNGVNWEVLPCKFLIFRRIF